MKKLILAAVISAASFSLSAQESGYITGSLESNDYQYVNDVASGAKAAVTAMDWAGLVLICFVLPAVLSWIFCLCLRKWGWIRENDLKLDL